VGNGEEESKIRLRIKDEGIEGVVIRPFMQHNVLPEAYSASDVFVFPTLGDPYGLVVDEAMASGLPIISTTAAGEIDVRVENHRNGYLVPPANSAALYGKMNALADDSDLRARMGGQSEIMIAGNTPDHFAENFERAIEAMIRSG
jgi:glycosyltransferase involved in cell wall biosynthesis